MKNFLLTASFLLSSFTAFADFDQIQVIQRMTAEINERVQSRDIEDVEPFELNRIQDNLRQVLASLEGSRFDICTGNFSGFYQGISNPLNIALTRNNQPNGVNVVLNFQNRTWTGNGTCQQTDRRSASVTLYMSGAPVHAGTITRDRGQVVFSGSQNPGYPFSVSFSR